MAGVVAAASLDLRRVGVLASQLDRDAVGLERPEALQLRWRHAPPDEDGEPHVVPRRGRRNGDAVVAAAGRDQRRLRSAFGNDRDLVVRPARLERVRRLELLALQPDLGGSGCLGQLTARLEGSVEGDALEARPRGDHVGEGRHARRHALECRPGRWASADSRGTGIPTNQEPIWRPAATPETLVPASLSPLATPREVGRSTADMPARRQRREGRFWDQVRRWAAAPWRSASPAAEWPARAHYPNRGSRAGASRSA